LSRGIALLFLGPSALDGGMGDQPHAPAASTPGKDPVPIVQEAYLHLYNNKSQTEDSCGQWHLVPTYWLNSTCFCSSECDTERRPCALIFPLQYTVESKILTLSFQKWPGIAQSVQRLATGWMVWGLHPGGGEKFCTRLYRPCGQPSLQYNGHSVFPGVKRPSSGVDHPPTTLAPRLRKE